MLFFLEAIATGDGGKDRFYSQQPLSPTDVADSYRDEGPDLIWKRWGADRLRIARLKLFLSGTVKLTDASLQGNRLNISGRVTSKR